MRIKDIGIGSKIGLNFVVVFVLAAGAVYTGMREQARANQIAERTTGVEARRSGLMRDVLGAAQDNARSTMELMLTIEPAAQERIKAAIEVTRKRNADSIAELDKLLAGDEIDKRKFGEVQALRKSYIDIRSRSINTLQNPKERDAAVQIWMKEALPALGIYKSAAERLVADRVASDIASMAEVKRADESAQTTMLWGFVLALLAGGLLIWWLARSITRPLRRAVEVSGAIAAGDFNSVIVTGSRDEAGQLLSAFALMQDQLRSRAESDRMQLIENLRVRQALDSAAIGVRICDNDGVVVYANRMLLDTVTRLESAIRKTAPHFAAKTFVGSSVGQLYADPAAALTRLRNLSETRKTVMEIGGREFEVVTTPMLSDSNERLGSIGQWVDRTEELRAEKEISEVVHGATMGDFSRRVDVTGKEGFLKQVAEQLNQIMATSEQAVGEVVKTLGAMSHGDMTIRVDGEYAGLFGELKTNANGTIEQLTEVIERIRQASESINTAAKEIASGNTDLSNRTEQQASSLEETASSMEELTATVKQNAESSKQANQLASGASETAMRGGDTVGQVVLTMSQIAESSKRIQDIIGVIDGIAFQTNILALNAAVEAARAGEQGRGFAVVATEVRNLAQRSAAAAKEIKELITESVGKVDTGTSLVQQAGMTMEEIVQAVKRVSDIIAEITAASVEQSAGIEQVNQAVTQMDQMTQQNAALVEQAAAAAESLEEQAQNLDVAVGIFKIGDAGQGRSNGQAGVENASNQRRAPTHAKSVARLASR